MDAHILDDLKASYGLICRNIIPVSGGWMNKKWKITTDEGDLLVKQFSAGRYRPEKFPLIEAALQRQILLQKNGVSCPAIRQHGGCALRHLDDGTIYMVMTFCAGNIETPDSITLAQMHSLGDACGAMHKAFAQLPIASVDGYPKESAEIIDSLWANYHTRMREDIPAAPASYWDAVRSLGPILGQLTPAFLDTIPRSISHEDFSGDNMLFDADNRCVILDFDRNHYNFPLHDVGRALLCFALENDSLNIPKIGAFIEGYTLHLPLSMSDIADALRLSWCIETPWWIQPVYFQPNTEKVVRFRDEILWLTAHWHEIDSLLGI